MNDVKIKFFKKNNLPTTLEKDSVYFDKIEGKTRVNMILTDNQGNPLGVVNEDAIKEEIDNKVGNIDTDFLSIYNISKIT